MYLRMVHVAPAQPPTHRHLPRDAEHQAPFAQPSGQANEIRAKKEISNIDGLSIMDQKSEWTEYPSSNVWREENHELLEQSSIEWKFPEEYGVGEIQRDGRFLFLSLIFSWFHVSDQFILKMDHPDQSSTYSKPRI